VRARDKAVEPQIVFKPTNTILARFSLRSADSLGVQRRRLAGVVNVDSAVGGILLVVLTDRKGWGTTNRIPARRDFRFPLRLIAYAVGFGGPLIAGWECRRSAAGVPVDFTLGEISFVVSFRKGEGTRLRARIEVASGRVPTKLPAAAKFGLRGK